MDIAGHRWESARGQGGRGTEELVLRYPQPVARDEMWSQLWLGRSCSTDMAEAHERSRCRLSKKESDNG